MANFKEQCAKILEAGFVRQARAVCAPERPLGRIGRVACAAGSWNNIAREHEASSERHFPAPYDEFTLRSQCYPRGRRREPTTRYCGTLARI